MAKQEIIITMHTLNKYGVPCEDVTEYFERLSSSGNPAIFYMEKTPVSFGMFTKMKPLSGGGDGDGNYPDPFEPVTGIPGYVFCVFRNDAEEFGNKGYCDYYSLGSGSLMATIELPYMVASSVVKPAVDINTDVVVYDPVIIEDQSYQYGRFKRDAKGSLTIQGHVLCDTGYYFPDALLFVAGLNSYTGEDMIPPRNIPYTAFNVEDNTVTLLNHGFVDGDNEWINFNFVGTPPGGLVSNKWYVVVNVTVTTFQLAVNPMEQNPWTGNPIDITSQGTGFGVLVVDYGNYGYDNAKLQNDANSMYPVNIHENRLYVNRYGEDKQTGRLYYEELPDLTDNNYIYKRMVAGYINLFVGELAVGTEYVIEVPFSNLLDANYPDKEIYTDPVKVFNDQVDDGSGKYIIGSGQIQARFYYNSLFIILTFDDIRGTAGNQAYQKWYNSSGQFLYEWMYPFYTNSQNVLVPYVLTGRVNHQNSFFYVLGNPETNESWLRQYNLLTGYYVETKLENPYKDEAVSGGYYKISNLQLIQDKYLMCHFSGANGHTVFFDAYVPSAGIQGEIVLDVTNDYMGYYVIPSIGVNEPATSPITNTLLELCNDYRSLKMEWAIDQVQVCQDHADWCVANSCYQHEGPVAGEDAPTSLGRRNAVLNIFAGFAENLCFITESNPEDEMIRAFEGWKLSPHHWNNIIRGGNKYMSFACATYPESVTHVVQGIGQYLGDGNYSTEPSIFEIPENLRGKYKIYVQNFIWY